MLVRVLQWNVWAWESLDAILDTLRGIDADILCLQELTTESDINGTRNEPEEIASHLGYASHFVEANEAPVVPGGGPWKIGNAVFSRFPIVAKQHHLIREATDPSIWSGQGRVYVEARLDLGTGTTPLTVATAHVSYAPGFPDDGSRDNEFDALLDAVGRTRSRYVFTGDLNSTPDSRLVRELGTRLTHCGPATIEPSWTTKPFDDGHGFTEIERRWRLDYAFASHDLRVVDAAILEVDASDHLPVLVSVDVN